MAPSGGPVSLRLSLQMSSCPLSEQRKLLSRPTVVTVCSRCGRVPGVCHFSMSTPVCEHPGLIPLHLPPWIPAVGRALRRSVFSRARHGLFIHCGHGNSGIMGVAHLSHNTVKRFGSPDIDECARNVCPPGKECRNTEGGYQCFDSCPAGMTKAESGVCVGEWQALIHPSIHPSVRPHIRHLSPLILHSWFPGVLESVPAAWLNRHVITGLITSDWMAFTLTFAPHSVGSPSTVV